MSLSPKLFNNILTIWILDIDKHSLTMSITTVPKEIYIYPVSPNFDDIYSLRQSYSEQWWGHKSSTVSINNKLIILTLNKSNLTISKVNFFYLYKEIEENGVLRFFFLPNTTLRISVNEIMAYTQFRQDLNYEWSIDMNEQQESFSAYVFLPHFCLPGERLTHRLPSSK